MSDDLRFRSWMQQVDVILIGATGLTHTDMVDQTWRDWFDDGLTPHEAANEAIEGDDIAQAFREEYE